jgi:membrane protein YdbS with pleckstrin-like domain
MQEEQRNWDPDIKKFFIRIVNSFAIGMMWLIAVVFAGLYYQLGFFSHHPLWHVVVFYVVLVITLLFVIRHLVRLWRS